MRLIWIDTHFFHPFSPHAELDCEEFDEKTPREKERDKGESCDGKKGSAQRETARDVRGAVPLSLIVHLLRLPSPRWIPPTATPAAPSFST